MHNSIQIIGNVGRNPEQRVSRANRTPFTILSVATRRAWKKAQGEWKSKTDWHRVGFNRLNDAASTLRTGDQVLIAGSLLSNQYEREVGKGKKPTCIRLTSWQIRANVIRKLNRTARRRRPALAAPNKIPTKYRSELTFRLRPRLCSGLFFVSKSIMGPYAVHPRDGLTIYAARADIRPS